MKICQLLYTNIYTFLICKHTLKHKTNTDNQDGLTIDVTLNHALEFICIRLSTNILLQCFYLVISMLCVPEYFLKEPVFVNIKVTYCIELKY